MWYFLWNWMWRKQREVRGAVSNDKQDTKTSNKERDWLHRIVIIDKLIVAEMVKKFSALNRMWSLITVITSVRQWTLLWASWIHSAFCRHVCLKLILMVSSHLYLGLESGLFPWRLSAKILYAFVISACYISRPRKQTEIRFYKVTIVQTLLYGSKTWAKITELLVEFK
jgi:hypothetical protein